jgi:hypothetical protein
LHLPTNMMTAKQLSGEILPRDYGLILQGNRGPKVFMSPAKYAIATLMLERPGQIRARLRDKAQQEGLSFEDLVQKFTQGVKRKHGTKNILNRSGRNAVQNVALYGNQYTAQVKAKSNQRKAFYDVRISQPIISEDYGGSVSCDCQDDRWNDVKALETLCMHAAALQVAFETDNRSGKSAKNNITGLVPSKRFKQFMPFGIGEYRSSAWSRLITQIAIEYYIENKSYFDLNKRLLGVDKMYTPQVMPFIESSKASFGVLRQREKTAGKGNEQHAKAVKYLQQRVRSRLLSSGFHFAGYYLENKGTEHEVIAQRFVDHSAVYGLCIKNGELPYVVRKHLGEKVSDWVSAQDIRIDLPLSRIGEKYLSIDDFTRRESLTQIILPSNENIPSYLQRKYTQLSIK